MVEEGAEKNAQNTEAQIQSYNVEGHQPVVIHQNTTNNTKHNEEAQIQYYINRQLFIKTQPQHKTQRRGSDSILHQLHITEFSWNH